MKTIQFTSLTATGTQDITIPGLGTCVGAMFFYGGSGLTSEGVHVDAVFGMGATDGTTDWMIGYQNEDDQALTDVSTKHDDDGCVMIYNESGSIQARATFSAFIVDGITINWAYNILGTGVLVTAVLFGEDEYEEFVVGWQQFNGTIDTASSVSIGFEPDGVIAASCSLSAIDTAVSGLVCSVGFAVNDGSDIQKSVCIRDSGGTAAHNAVSYVSSNRILTHTDSAVAPDWEQEIDNFSATGFDFISRLAGTTDYGAYIAFKLRHKSAYIVTKDSPTSTGDWALTGAGFQPDFGMILLSYCAVEDTPESDSDAGIFGVSVFDRYKEYCIATAWEDGQSGNTNTETGYDDVAIFVNDGDGSEGLDATVKSLDSDGFTFDFTVVDGTARKWPVLLIGYPPPTTGKWVDDLVIPKSIEATQFAADGAIHIDPSSDNAKYTVDTTRIRQAHVLHDWSFKTGTVASPTDHLLCHLKCDENAASANLADETANNADGTWSEFPGNGDRNTNISGDSVIRLGRGRTLYTQDGTGYIEMGNLATTHDNSFLSKGSILLEIEPVFGYNTSDYQQIFEIYINGNNYIGIWYDDNNDYFVYDFYAGGTGDEIDTPAYTASNPVNIPMIILCSWDFSIGWFAFSINGVMIGSGYFTVGTLSVSDPATFYIGGDNQENAEADIYIGKIKTFDECILPYGAYFTGNETVDTDVAHKDITLYMSGSEGDTDAPSIGNSTITFVNSPTNVSALVGNGFQFDNSNEYISVPVSSHDNINYQLGTISLWFKSIGQPDSNGTFFSNASDYLEFSCYRKDVNELRWELGNDTWDILIDTADIWDGNWHHIRWVWDQVNSYREFFFDGISRGTHSDIMANPDIASQALYIGGDGSNNLNGIIDQIFITNSPYTPQIWTAFGKPRHMSLIKR